MANIVANIVAYPVANLVAYTVANLVSFWEFHATRGMKKKSQLDHPFLLPCVSGRMSFRDRK